mmetsp:Transcript_1975/g.2563  ORF Transcript_1975/g.2563 Transcript_1975/m.2563 type:complete len:447 (+) Transcript_1975:158-1498(+)
METQPIQKNGSFEQKTTIPSSRKKHRKISAKRAKLQAKLEPLKNRFSSNAIRAPTTDVTQAWLQNPDLKASKSKLTRLDHHSRKKTQAKSLLRKQDFLYKNVDLIMSKMLENLVLERPADIRKWTVTYLAKTKGPAFVQKYDAALELKRKVEGLRSERDQLKGQMRNCLRRHHSQLKHLSGKLGELQKTNAQLKESLRVKLRENMHRRPTDDLERTNALLKGAFILRVRQMYNLQRAGGLGGMVKEVMGLQDENQVLRCTLKEKITAYYKTTRDVGDIPAIKEENAALKEAFRSRLRKQINLMSEDTDEMLEYQKNLMLRKEFAEKAATNYHLLMGKKEPSLPNQLRSTIQLVRSASQDEKLEKVIEENHKLKMDFAQKIGNPSVPLADALQDNISLKALLEAKMAELERQKASPTPSRNPRSPREKIAAYKASVEYYQINNIVSG